MNAICVIFYYSVILCSLCFQLGCKITISLENEPLGTGMFHIHVWLYHIMFCLSGVC